MEGTTWVLIGLGVLALLGGLVYLMLAK